jgi:pyruvate dehydrogenase E2 component (dihydrolipoamide acetyltransferase)
MPMTASRQLAYVTPAVRALVRSHDVNVQFIAGSGVNARVTKRDVLTYLQRRSQSDTASRPASVNAAGMQRTDPNSTQVQVTVAPGRSGRTQTLSGQQTTIAVRMVESLRVSAQLTTVVEADITRVAKLRDDYNARIGQAGPQLSYLPFIAKATCEALITNPVLNASLNLEGNEVTYSASIALGIAINTDRGLLVPVVRRAEDLNVLGLARGISDVNKRTRDSHVTPDELTGGTFTITNTGGAGMLFETPILQQPQVGILGVGAVMRRPVVTETDDGQEAITIRSMVYLSLTYDHRLVDGADAARFLTSLRTRIEGAGFEHDLV